MHAQLLLCYPFTYVLHMRYLTGTSLPRYISKSAQTFEPDIVKKNTPLFLPQNSTLNTMVSLVLLVIVRTARVACGHTHTHAHTHTHTHTHTHKTTTVTLAVHACRGLIIACFQVLCVELSMRRAWLRG